MRCGFIIASDCLCENRFKAYKSLFLLSSGLAKQIVWMRMVRRFTRGLVRGNERALVLFSIKRS